MHDKKTVHFVLFTALVFCIVFYCAGCSSSQPNSQNQEITAPKEEKKNPYISWTLNKAAVIDKRWLLYHKNEIQDMDWWRVKIECTRAYHPG